MKLAVVGSRQGADLEHVEQFVRSLPDGLTIVSGGAAGVDTTAEQTWRSLGGSVVSFRVKRFPDYGRDEVYGVQRLDLNDTEPRATDLIHEPTFATYVSALVFRDMLIAEECDRVAAHMRKGGSRGTKMTCQFARNEGKPVYEYEA